MPPTLVEPRTSVRHVAPAALLAFTLDPPLDTGPFTGFHPTRRWGLPTDAHGAFLDAVRDWSLSGAATWAGEVTTMPLTEHDHADVINHLLARRQRWKISEWDRDPAASTSDGSSDGNGEAPALQHLITLGHFGTSYWSNGAPGRTTQAAVDDLLGLVTRLAAHLDVARIGAATPGSSEEHHLTSGRFRLLRHRWQRHVPDAAYAQLLTDHHMAHLGDLSAWQVDEVSPGRHLVRWPRLDDWFTEPDPLTGKVHPDPAVLEQARHDFAALVPTKETVKEHPLRPPA